MSQSTQSDLLDASRITASLTPQARALLTELSLHDQIDSTNTEALRRLESLPAGGLVIAAEQQVSGRGRRGRSWASPHGCNLYVSAVWDFERGAEAMAGLSLAVGVAVADALEHEGLDGIGLKWPNDILHGGGKLGGILIEIAGHASGRASAVVGIGVNLSMPDAEASAIDQPWTDARRAGGLESGRNQLLASLLNHLLPLLAEFEDSGFPPWRERWTRRNAHDGAQVVLTSGESTVTGIVQGVDDTGALLLDLGGTVRAFTGGEVSLRAAT